MKTAPKPGPQFGVLKFGVRVLKALQHGMLVLGLVPGLVPGLLLMLMPTPSHAAGAHKKPGHTSAHAAAARDEATRYGPRADVVDFANGVADRRGLSRVWLLQQLAQARRNAGVQRLIMPPPAGRAKDWAEYRRRFIEPHRISAGVAFWQANEASLARAEQRWGVAPEIVVGIIGVETFYGRITGHFRVLDALATLSFDFPSGRRDRSEFFRAELEAFLVWCEREGRDPQTVKGSFAGAIGLAQFMPSSLNRIALDFDGDGHTDLATSSADAIGSIAHFLAAAGWQRALPTHFSVAQPVDSRERAALLAPDIRPSFSAAEFAEHGAVLEDAARSFSGLLALVELQNGERAPSFVAGTPNFYAITRYNWSSYYAMAVIELGAAVAAERERAGRR